MSTRLLTGLLIAGLLSVITIRCSNDKSENPRPKSTSGCDTLNITYTDDVAPITNNNCAVSGCHTNSNSSPPRGLTLDTYNDVKQAVNNRPLLCAIKHGSDCSVEMPFGQPKLSQDTIRTIECWIENGMPQ